MKQHLVFRRWAMAAGLCLLLIGVLTVSLGWATASSPLPAATRQARAAGEVSPQALDASSGQIANARAAQPVAVGADRSAQGVSSKAESAKRDAAGAVRRAWEMARIAGVYAFTTDLVQTSYPARTLANSGRGPQRYELHLEGEVDQPARTLEFRLWQPGMAGSGGAASSMAPGSGAEARIEGDRAYLRQAGGEWKEVEDFSASFAPGNDPMAFLAGIKSVREVPAEEYASRTTHYVSRFTFELDGPAFATYMRDQLERQLAERGELPLNVTLDAPDSFRQMTGSGELWVDGRGLPMRLAMHLALPEQSNGARLEADVQTAFSGFPEQVAAAPSLAKDLLAWTGALFSESAIRNQKSVLKDVVEGGGTGGALACSLAITALLLACRRSRRLYAAVVIAVIFSMVVVPLMQSERAVAFFERQTTRSKDLMDLSVGPERPGATDDQAANPESVQEQPAAREENLAPAWDPHRDPLAQPEQAEPGRAPITLSGSGDASSTWRVTTEESASGLPLKSFAPLPATPAYDLNCPQTATVDTDSDGVSDYQECVYFLDSGKFDKDGDKLSDGQELNKLGTDPTKADTDGDFITDTVEVQGFTYGGQQWYLNPNHPDTNGDGLLDSVECPVLVDLANPTEADLKSGCDSDQDGIPNPFAIDNDGDGVPDKVDLSPDESLDMNQKRFGQPTAATAFHDDQPFLFSLAGLEQGWPVLVDLQMRPVTPTHLSYAMNVLDWPSRDLDGQLQHWKSTTFKDSDNPDVKNPDDDPGANGDMRLVPLLEIVMTGAHVPLALTGLAVTAEVRAKSPEVGGSEISSTVTMTPNATNTDSVLAFKFDNASSYAVKIYSSACPVSGSAAATFAGVSNANATQTYQNKRLVDLADGHHAMLVSGGGVEVCADIPNVVNGPYTDKMVDASALAPYQITVQDRDDGAVVAYVQLSVAPDDTGGGKSAFQAHMIYRPGEGRSWDEPQQMRIIWLVQMITDSCNENGFPLTEEDRQEDPEGYNEALHAWCDKKEHRTMDQLLPVQVYDESWYLTGLSVREDHGLDVAVASVNKDLATYNDDALWTLSWGLGQQFVTGRDCETWDTTKGVCVGDRHRDLSVFTKDRSGRTIGNSTIEQRFDYTTTATLNQRWGIQGNPFPLRVDSFRYDSVDYAGYLSSTETPRILKELQGKWGTGFYPTLLFAHEERFRSAFLSAAEMPSSGVLTIDMSNTATYPEQTTAGMLWAPFRYNKNMSEWEGYPSSDYWSQLGNELEARFPAQPVETNAGQVATARAYYYALFAGVQGAIHCTPDELKCSTGQQDGSDETIASAIAALGGLHHAAIEVIPEALGLKQHVKTNDVPIDAERNGLYVTLDASLQNKNWSDAASLAAVAFNWVGQTVQGYVASPYIVFRIGPVIPMDAGPLAGAAVVSLDAALYAASQNLNMHETAVRVFNALYMSSGYLFAGIALKAIDKAGGFAKAAVNELGFIKNLKCVGGVFGAVVAVGYALILWASFAIQWAMGSLTAGSMAWDNALMETITMTIVTIVLWVVFTCLGPIGDLLNALKIIINGLIALICSILPQEMQESAAADWICGGITGFLAKYLESLFYSGTLIVNIDPHEDKGPPWYPRLNLHDFEMDLVDPEAGMVTGNAMRYSARLTNTIDLNDVPLRRQELWWSGQFDDDNLKKSTFDYRWQEAEQDFHDPLSLGGMKNSWLPTKGGRPFYYTETVATEGGFQLGAAGINRPVEGLFFSEAYALPEQECWGYGAAKYCYIATEKGTSNFDMGSGLFYDILPPTLDGFYQLTGKADGYALAWGQKGDLTFPTLFDADGDGLARTDDHNDSKWDADDDGLSDVYELDFGSNSTERDTDDDGLTDYQEAQFGSDPTNPDSDGDGLYDCEEVLHQVLAVGDENVRKVCGEVLDAWTGGWTIVYYGADPSIPLRTLVTSNPVEADTDGDGLTDHQEQIYGYNPTAYSMLNVLSLHTELGELLGTVIAPTDGFVAPGQTLHFEATVKNELDDRQAEGLLSTVASPFLDMTGARDQSFNLRPQAQANQVGDLKVLSSAASGAYSLTQVAGALIANLTAESDQAALWLRFDDPAAPYVDWSDSLTPHNGACFDQNGASSSACVQEPAGGRIGGGLKLAGAGYVEVPLDVSEKGYAVSLWFKTTSSGGGLFSVDDGTRGANGHDRHLFLSLGNVCARLYVGVTDPKNPSETKCTYDMSYADGQWHHVVHTFGLDSTGQTQAQKIYVDGVVKATGTKTASDFTWQDGINIGFSNDASPNYFTGSIDDVRVFDKALNQAEVQELANLPLFHMSFDQTSTWADVSSFKTAVSGSGATHDGPAVHGYSVNFDGSSYLSVLGGTAAPQLDLSLGHFTLSAWVYPRNHGDSRDTHAQGILGLNSGLSNAYPSLQRVGKKIQFSLGTGSQWVTPVFLSGDVLMENQWNHVGLTLNKDEGKVRLYVNGELKGDPFSFAGSPPATAKSFDIGRSSNIATVKFDDYIQGEHGDGGLSCECILGNDSEMCMAIDQQEAWNQEGGLCCTEKGSLNASKTFAEGTGMVLWEDDDDPDCGSGPSKAPTQAGNDDDTCQVWWGGTNYYNKGTSQRFTTNDASFTDRDYEFNNCGTGDFHGTLTNNSVPFYGYMDEVQIYGQALDQDAIRQLYLDAATLLRLPLDEAPGAVAFKDLSLARVPASCAATGCPTSGTTGRINRAAQFDSSKKNAISLNHSTANELTTSFTVAAWIKPNTTSSVQNIVSTARTKTNNGWGLRLNGSNLEFEPYGYGVTTSSSLGLKAGRWTHVVAVIDASYKVKFYVDDALWLSQGHSGYYGGVADTDDPMLVGATQATGATTPSQFFDGQIDDLWIFNTALSESRITELYKSAPVLHMLLDDATGTTQFADSAAYGRYGTCTKTATTDACPLTGEGIRGQVGLAAQFDGVNDNVTVGSFGDFNETTVSAWVYRTGATKARETIVSYKENSNCGFVLDLNDDATNQYPRFHVRVGSSWLSATDDALGIPTNQWVHLVGTYNGSKIRLYRNGVLKKEQAAAGSMVNTCTDILAIGSRNAAYNGAWHWFPGLVDEVQVYGRALTPEEIQDLYDYQSAWIEGRQSHNITVDSDSPTADLLIADGSYLADQAIWVGVTADDPTSGVDKVELGVQKSGGELTWSTAVRCAQNAEQPEGAWCARFDPPGADPQGPYTLHARATDRVGRTGSFDKVGVNVDNAAPELYLDQVSYQRVDALMSGNKPQTWVVRLSGYVKDPPIWTSGGNVPGSGVPADGVRVTLRDAEGKALGDDGQRAIVAGEAWSLDYMIQNTEPDGCFEVEVEAEDQVARIPSLDPHQVSLHTATLNRWVVLDGSAPVVLLDQPQAIASGQMVSTTKTLGGEASSRPVPVQVDLTAADGADKTRVRLTCQHGEGTWYTLFDLQSGTLTAGSTQHWEGEIHQGSPCRVELTTTATPAGGVSGVVTVCREQLPGWTGNFTDSKSYDFMAQSDSCSAAGCPASPPVAGVQGADVAFRSVLPGSAFFNEVPLSGEVLHLPFEDTPGANSGLVREVSGSGVNGTCSASGCPTLGQAGPSGNAAWFDGVDDNVQVIDDNRWDFAAGQDFTIAVWARPDAAQPDSGYTDHSIVEKWSASGGYPYAIRYFDQNDKTYPGKIAAARYQGTQPQPVIFSDRQINDGRLHHLVFVKIGSTLSLYIDGTVAGTTSDNTTGTTTNSSGLFIGQRGNGHNHFAGMVDDLRIFNRGLSAAEVMALYTGPRSLLALSFEEPWVMGGDSVADASGWGHNGKLNTGTGDPANKATTGQVGTYAAKLDGVDDYVSMGSTPDLKLSNSATLAAWIYPTAAKNAPILNREGEYEVYRYADGTIRWAFANTTPGWTFVNTGYVAQLNVWTHIAVVYDAGIVRTYANGALVNTYNGAGTIGDTVTDQNELRIGGRSSVAADRFGGSIDEVRVYGRALPAQEIADLYHAGWQAVTLPSGGAGAERTSWTVPVPAGLEGSYQVEMRGRDVATHAGAVSNSSLLWRGEADNLNPRVTLTKKVVNSTTNEYTTVAEDYHLAETSFSSPCGAGFAPTRETFLSPWYLGITGDDQKLYRLTAVCAKTVGTVTEKATACDSFGNCATVGVTAAGSPQPSEEDALLVEGSVGGPPLLSDLSGLAAAPDLPLEGTSPGSGKPIFEILFVTDVLTSTHYEEPLTVGVSGWVVPALGAVPPRPILANVTVSIDGVSGAAILSAPAPTPPYTVTWRFPWRLPAGALPDGAQYAAVVTATDRLGRATTERASLTVDVVPPEPVTLTLSSGGAPLAPGEVVQSISPELALAWTPSADGSGLVGYVTTWTVRSAATTTVTSRAHAPAGLREDRIMAGEAQRISVGLASRDIHGNERWQEFGSVVVDDPLTPDYITSLPSPELGRGTGGEGWMDSGCTLLGADWRISRRGDSGRWAAQQLYATWDHRALRLAWTGANWSGDGDLFIYLDTGPGGTGSTFTPSPVGDAGMTLRLPADLQADLVIWVQDGHTASLLRWNGSDWAVERRLGAEQFHFDAARNGGQTDLYLPFEMLGIQAGASLGLLAFAAEEPAPDAGLRVWATLPLVNPLNSNRVNRRLPLAPRGSVWPLRHAYRWMTLGDGICPNGTREGLMEEQHNDAVLQMTIQSDPPTATASGVSDDLFWVNDPSDVLGATGAGPLFGFLRALRPPLPDGQEIAYMVSYRNDGSQALEGAWLDLSAFGPLRLASNRIELGDIPPGGEGSVTFQGTVDRSVSQTGVAAAVVKLQAASKAPDERYLEWLVAARRVDLGAPEEMGLEASAVMGPEAGWLSSYAYDESGVSRVDIEVVGPSGATSTLTCDAPGSVSTRWSCPWDPAAANGGIRPQDGDEYTLSIRAADRFGSTSGWSAPRTIRVDAQPPTITLAAEASSAYPGRLVRGNAVRLIGDTQDNHAVGNVTVCVDGDACRTADVSMLGDSSSPWSLWLLAGGALDYVTKTVTIRATDRLGNSMDKVLKLPVVFDSVAPALVANQILAQVPLRSTGGLPVSSTETVLNGTVGDGGPDVAVSVRVQPPSGDVTRISAGRDGETWWFDLPADVPGQYTLWADAQDQAGNVTTVGPFTVDVTCTHAAPVAMGLTAEPVAGWPMSLTLTTVISNAGPEPLPSGISLDLNEGVTFIGSATTAGPLESGESQALSLIWAPDSARDFDIAVSVGQTQSHGVDGIANLPYGPLCVAPPAAHFTLPVRDTPLFYGWTLLSPPVNPSNRAAEVVQRGIDEAYAAVLGYDSGLLAYYPGRPQESTLQKVDALHGYWISMIVAAGQPPTDTVSDESAATWRMAGELLPEDQPLQLASGWNLASYLPRRALTVTTALQGIEGQYTSVLGFDRTALSYYPDLDGSYNTLGWMAPGYGYWISAKQASTLHYPVTGITDTVPITATRMARDRLDQVRLAELRAGVQPTYEWMNFSGKLALLDGTGAPTGTLVLAVDPQGVICGATATWEVGQYGLLACYRDDPGTAADEGAVPGDEIRLVMGEGTPPQPGSWVIGEGTWTAHGARQQVPAGPRSRSLYLPLLLRETSLPVQEPQPAPLDEVVAAPEPAALP